MPISIDDRINLILKTQFGKLYTSSQLTLGQELESHFTIERDQIFGQPIPDIYPSDIIWSERENFDQIIEYGSKERILTGPNYLTQTYHATTNITLLYKLPFNTITDFSTTGLEYNIYTGRTITDVTYSNNFIDYSGNYFDFETNNNTILKYVIYNSDHQYNRNAPSDLIVYGKNSNNARWNYLKQFTLTHEDYLYDSRDVNANDVILDLSFNETYYKKYRISVGRILNDFNEEAVRIIGGNILWTNETITNWTDFPWTDYQTELEAIGLKIDDTDNNYISNVTNEPIWIRIDINPQNIEPYRMQMLWSDLPKYTYVDPSSIGISQPTTITPGTPITIDGPTLFAGPTFNGNIQIATHYYGTMVLDKNNDIWAWGYNGYGELGVNDTNTYSSPTKHKNKISVSAYALTGKTIAKICSGYHTSCAITDEGKVYTWGYNSHGQHLNGQSGNYPMPQLVPGLSHMIIRNVEWGAHHAIALSNAGNLYTWGYNSHGQRGNGTTAGNNLNMTPYFIELDDDGNSLTDTVFTQISSNPGGYHCFALRDDGRVFSWGNNSTHMDLGHFDNNIPILRPKLITHSDISNVSNVVGCYEGGMVLTTDGQIYGWGYNGHGNLGKENDTNRAYEPIKPQTKVNGVTYTLADVVSIVKIVRCDRARYAIDSNGTGWSWGYNGHGELGRGGSNTWEAREIIKDTNTIMPNVTDIVTGMYFTHMLADGVIYSFGANSYGCANTSGSTASTVSSFAGYSRPDAWGNQFDVSGTDINAAKKYTLENDEIIINNIFNYDNYNGNIQIAASTNYSHTSILTSNNEVYVWGYGGYGQIGNNTTSSHNYTPQLIPDSYFNNKKIVKIFCGYERTGAITNNGEVYMWGNGSYNAFLRSNNNNSNTPALLSWFGDNNKRIVDVTSGQYSWMALSDEGKVFTWGTTTNKGERGDGTTNSYNYQTAPFELSDFNDNNNGLYGKEVIFIKNVFQHCMAVTSENELYTWGENYLGELGPVIPYIDTISGLEYPQNTGTMIYARKVNFDWGGTIVQIEASQRGSMVLTDNGRVFNWGAGADYRNGTNNTSNVNYPTTPIGLGGVNIIKIASGYEGNRYAISSDGKLYIWGRGNNGALGNNTTDDTKVATLQPQYNNNGQQVSLENVTDIVPGRDNAYVVSNGKIYAWGYNGYSTIFPDTASGSNRTIPYEWPTINGKTSNFGLGDFTYEGTQIRTDYINFNTLRRQFGKTIFSPDSYTETFSSAAWYDNPGSQYDKYRGYTLPIIRQIGPKANIDDIWGAKLRLYNDNGNSYHTSPNNYSNDEPWIKVTFLSNIDGMIEKPLEPLRNPHALMNSNSNYCHYNGNSINWQQDEATRLIERNGVPGDLQNYWHLKFMNLGLFNNTATSSWIHPDAGLLKEKEDTFSPENSLFNDSNQTIYVEISVNDNYGLHNGAGDYDKITRLPTTIDWYANTVWILYTLNDLSNNTIQTSSDYIINTFPHVIELQPGEWIERMAVPEYYQVFTDIPQHSWAVGKHYAYSRDTTRNTANTSTLSWTHNNQFSWWRINIYNDDPRFYQKTIPYNLQTSDNYFNPSNNGSVHINDFKIFGRDVYDINNVFNGETHYDNPSKVWGYGNNTTTLELLDASNVSVTTIQEAYSNAYLTRSIGYNGDYTDTFARDPADIYNINNTALNGRINYPIACVYDTERECYYISDYSNHAIRKVYTNSDGTVNLRTIAGYNNVGYNHENISDYENLSESKESGDSQGTNTGIFGDGNVSGNSFNRTAYPGQMVISHDNKFLFWLYNCDSDQIHMCELTSGMFYKWNFSQSMSRGSGSSYKWVNHIAIDRNYNLYVNIDNYHCIVKIPFQKMQLMSETYDDNVYYFEIPWYEQYSGHIVAGCYNMNTSNIEMMTGTYITDSSYHVNPTPFLMFWDPVGIVLDNDDNLYIMSRFPGWLVKCGPEEQVEIPSYGRQDPSSAYQEPLNGNWLSSYDYFKWLYTGHNSTAYGTQGNGWNGKLLAFYFDDQYVCSLRIGSDYHSYPSYFRIGFRNNSNTSSTGNNTIYFHKNNGIQINFYYLYQSITQYVDKGSTPYIDMQQGKISSYDELWPAALEPFKTGNYVYSYDPAGDGNYSNLNDGEQMVHRCKFKLHMRKYISHQGHPTDAYSYASSDNNFWDSITPEQVGTPEASAINGYGSRNINELYATFTNGNAALSYDKINNNIYVTQTNTVRKVDLDNNMFVKTIAGNPWNSSDSQNNLVEQTNWNSTYLASMGNIGIDLSENLYIPIHEYHKVIKIGKISYEPIYDVKPTTEEKLLTNIKEEILLKENNDEIIPVREAKMPTDDLVDVLMDENFEGVQLQTSEEFPGDETSGPNVWSNLMPNGWTVKTYNDHQPGGDTEFNGWRIANPYWLANVGYGTLPPSTTLEDIRTALNETNYDAIRSAITNGVYSINTDLNYNNYSIGDGGADMYDGGNRIRTNLGGDFYYYENISTSSHLAGNRYFTRLTVNKGLFIFVADLYNGGQGRTNNNNVSYIEIWGNLGADGGGTMTSGEYTSDYGGTSYKIYWKSVAGPGDPNINHVWVVKNVPGLSRDLATSTDNDYHRLNIPTNGDVDRIYYFLWGAPVNNGVTNQTEVNSMVSKFFEVTGVTGGAGGNNNYDGNIQISPGYYSTVVLDQNKDLWVWGYAGHNELGINSTTHHPTPQLQKNSTSALSGVTIAKINKGYYNKSILTTTGEIWSWGYGYYGENLNGSTNAAVVPQRIDWFPNNNVQIKQCQVGYHSYVALTTTGKMYTWGYNSHGQRGNGSMTHNQNNQTPYLITRDHAGNTLTSAVFIEICVRSHHCLALRDNDTLYSWGYGYRGGTCQGSDTNYSYPKIVDNRNNWGSTIVGLEATYQGGMALLETGEVYNWGYNGHYNCGINNTINQYTGVKPNGLPSTIVKVRSTYYSRYALSSNGELWGWGYNSHGQMADGGTSYNQVPDRLKLNSSTYMSGVTDITCGVHHTIIYANGQIYGLGYSYEGNATTDAGTENLIYPDLWTNQFGVTGTQIDNTSNWSSFFSNQRSQGFNIDEIQEVEKYTEPLWSNGQVAAIIPMGNYSEDPNLDNEYEVLNTHSGLKTPELNIFNYYKNSLEIELKSSAKEGTNIRINAIYDEDENNKVILFNKLVMGGDLYRNYKISLKNPLYAQTMRVEFECWGNDGFWIINDVKVTNNRKYEDYKSQFTSLIDQHFNLYTITSSGTNGGVYDESSVFNGVNTGNYSIGGWVVNYNASQFGWDSNGYYNKQGVTYSYYTEDVSGNVYNGPWIEVEKQTGETVYYIEIYPTENVNFAISTYNEGGRQPRNFRLYGSNNNLNHASHNNSNECAHCSTDWHLIQEWTDINSQHYWDGDYKYFTGIIDNPSNYKKYRLAINRITNTIHNDTNPSSGDARILQIGQIKFYGEVDDVYNNILTYTSPETDQLSEIIIDTNNQSKVYYIKIYPSNVERGYDAPSDFKLLASDDNNNWIDIQEWTGILPNQYYNGTRYLPYVGTLNSPSTYRYWKLQITKSTGFKMQVKQFQLYGSEINLSKYIAGTTLSIEDYNTALDSVDNRSGEEKRDLIVAGFLIGGSWEKLGDPILHTPYGSNSDHWGYSSAISGDGTTIIAGAPYHDPNNNTNRGMVKVYEWDGTDWQQKGNDIVGTSNNEYLGGVHGRACSISYDGDRIAYGGYYYNSYQGRVYVNDWNGSSWVQQTVQYGDSSNEYYGRSVSLSDDGTVLAVAAPWDDDTGGNDGRIEIFKNTSGTTWTSWGNIYGQDFEDGDGDDLKDTFGWGEGGGVQLSGDGTKVIVGSMYAEDPQQTAISNEGAAVVIQINGNNDFTKIGKTIFKPGEYPIINQYSSDHFGHSVAMSYDGTVIAVGSIYDDYDDEGVLRTNCGSMTVFKWSGTEWVQKGQKIVGYTSSAYCSAVSLSNDGNIAAAAFAAGDTNGSDTGYIHVLMYNSTTDKWDTMGTYTDIEGSDTNDENFIGHYGSLSISANGGKIVYGTYDYDLTETNASVSDTGIVRAYEYTGGRIYDTVDPNEDLDDKTGLLSGPGSITRNTTITYTASTEYSEAFYSFTGIVVDEEFGNGWISEENCYGNGGHYIKEEKLQTNDYFGEWIQINFSEQYVGTKIKLYQKSENILSAPEEFGFFGSNDGINWELIKEWKYTEDEWLWNNYILTLELAPKIKLYKHWRLVIKKVTGNQTSSPVGTVKLSQLELYGYKQQYFNLQDYVYAGVNTIEEAFELYGTEITQSTFNIEPYKLIFDLNKDLRNYYSLSSSQIELFTTLKNEKVISYDKNYNTTEFKVTGSYYTNENMLDYYKHSYSYAIRDISIDHLFDDKLTETSLNLEFENNIYNGNNKTDDYYGDWMEIDTKIPIKVSEIKIYLNEFVDDDAFNYTKISDMPKNYKLYASKLGDQWEEMGDFTTIESDISEENIPKYLPLELNSNGINIPGYLMSNGVLYKSKIGPSNSTRQLFEWNKSDLKLVPLSVTATSTSAGNVLNLDDEYDPFINSGYGFDASYTWRSGNNYRSDGTYIINNPGLTYEHEIGDWIQVDLGESKTLGYITLRPICGNSEQLFNPGPGSEITIYGSNNQELWIEVKKLENTYWGEPNSNYVLDYTLIAMDETVSFRYWRLFFNKSYEMVGVNVDRYSPGSTTWSWIDQYNYAVNQGKRLPLRSEILDNENILKVTGQDRWVAGLRTLDGGTGSSNRDWYQIGTSQHVYGKSHTDEYGYPSWGDGTVAGAYRENMVMVNLGYQTQVGLSEFKLYSPFSSLSNMITEEYTIDESYQNDINVRTITKPVTLSLDYYRYWRLVINEKHPGLSNQIKLKQIEMKGLEFKHDSNLLTLWRPEINKPIENYIIVNNADNQEVINWTLTSYNLSGINLTYREGNNEVFTNINKTFNLELFKDIKDIFENQSIENTILENKYMDVNSIEMISNIKSIRTEENSEGKYDYIKRYENVELERVHEGNNRIWHAKNNIMKEKMKKIIQGRRGLFFELMSDISGAEIINSWNQVFKPYVYNGTLIFMGEQIPLSNTILKFKVLYTFEGYKAPNAIVRQYDEDPSYLNEKPYIYYNKTEKSNKVTTGEYKELVHVGYDAFVENLCNQPDEMKNLREETKYYEVENTEGLVPSGWQKLPLAIKYDISANIEEIEMLGYNEMIENNDLLLDVNKDKIYKYSGNIWEEYYDLQDLSNNNLGSTVWTNANIGHWYRIQPYSYVDVSNNFPINGVNNGDIYINEEIGGLYQYNNDLKERNVIYRWDTVINWDKINIIITNLTGETPYTDPSGASSIQEGNLIALPIINRIKMTIYKNEEALTDSSNVTIFEKGDNQIYRADEYPNELRINLWTRNIEISNKIFNETKIEKGEYKIELWLENNSFNLELNKNEIFFIIN